MVNIPVLKRITEANALLADALRARFVRQDVLVLNIIASPGAGKTSLLERTIEKLHGELRLSVIEGDPTTSLDAERIVAAGVPAVQINTDGGCHLEARMIQVALEQLRVEDADSTRSTWSLTCRPKCLCCVRALSRSTHTWRCLRFLASLTRASMDGWTGYRRNWPGSGQHARETKNLWISA